MPTRFPEKHVSKRQSQTILATFVLIVILAVTIPPVVVTTLRKPLRMGPKSKVFVPLYVYPAPGAWAPLEDVYVSLSLCQPDQTLLSNCFLPNHFTPSGW